MTLEGGNYTGHWRIVLVSIALWNTWGKGKTALMPCNRSHGIEIRNLDADPIEGRSVIKKQAYSFQQLLYPNLLLLTYYPRLCMHASLFDPKERTKEVGYHRKQRRQVVMRLILERIIMRLITAPRPPQTTNVRHVVFVQYG